MRRLIKLTSVFKVIVIIFLASSCLLPSAASAISGSDRNSILNNTIWYQPNNGESSSNAENCDIDLSGSSNEDAVWGFLISNSFSPVQAAGIIGNLIVESGLNPKAVERGWGFPTEMDAIPPNVGPQGQPGYGIAQWTSPNRKAGLADKAQSMGKSPSDLIVQLNYLVEELKNNYSSTYQSIISSGDIVFVSKTFGHEYEGFGTNTEGLRLRKARGVLIRHSGDTDTGNSGLITCDDSSEGSIIGDPSFKIIKLSPPLATPGGQITPKGITLHWWGSDSHGEGIGFLVRALSGNSSCGSSGCSVQLGITDDGKVYQMTKNLTDLTYHATGGNNTTFGIEIEGGPSDFGAAGINKYPDKFNAVVSTVKYLVKKYNLPLEGPIECGNVSGIHPHKAYNSCPGALSKEDIDDTYFNAVMQKVRQ